jgi:hypothetical protein
MDDETDILAVNVIPEFSAFLSALKIENAGLGAKLFRSVYSHIFLESTDLRKEYERYYCVEYPTLSEYIECAHDEVLEEKELEKLHILKFKYDNGLMYEGYDDNVLEEVFHAIKKLEDGNEN